MTTRRNPALSVVAACVGTILALAGGGHLIRSTGAGNAAPSAVTDRVTGPSAAPSPAAPSGTPSPSPSPSASVSASASRSSASRSSASRSSVPRSSVPSAAPSASAPGFGATVARNAAAGLRTLPAGTGQVIIVTADGFGTSSGTLETFTKVAGVWQPALGSMPARLGVNGFADRKVEGDRETPTGVYAIGSTVYGIAANPGVRYGYHRLVPDDYWNENPASPGYNSFQHGPSPGGASEALWRVAPQYNYFAVINYNIPVVAANPPRGSGIFLHVSVGRATLGCVALAESDLLRVLRWLDPAAAPRIVLAPRSALSRY